MEIWIDFADGEWRTSPDPAEVASGTQIRWRFRGDGLTAQQVRWTIYFRLGHPFNFGDGDAAMPDARLDFATETLRFPDGQHLGTSPIVTADKEGQYKYGVRLNDLDQNTELGDDDPFLIVV